MKKMFFLFLIILNASCSSAPFLHIAPNQDGVGAVRTSMDLFADNEETDAYIKKICNSRYKTIGVTISSSSYYSLSKIQQTDFRCLKKGK